MDILIFDNNINIKYSKKKICENCNKEYNKLFNITNDKINKHICKLCSYVLVYKQENINKILLLKSNISQKEIITETYKFFSENKRIPLPNEIDSNAQIINYSSPILCELINKYPQIKEYTKNLRIFITDNNLFPKNLLVKDNKNENELYWTNINKLNIYNIPNDIIIVFNKCANDIDNLEIDDINKYKNEYINLINKNKSKNEILKYINNL